MIAKGIKKRAGSQSCAFEKFCVFSDYGTHSHIDCDWCNYWCMIFLLSTRTLFEN